MTANEMRKMRRRLGMTQPQLAEALGVSTATIANYEGGRKDPRPIPRVVALACETLIARAESPA